jgi:hypothetical protein
MYATRDQLGASLVRDGERLVAPIFDSWRELRGQALPRSRSLQPVIGETRNDALELCAIVLRDHRPPELRSEPEHEHEGPPPKPSGIVGHRRSTDAKRRERLDAYKGRLCRCRSAATTE